MKKKLEIGSVYVYAEYQYNKNRKLYFIVLKELNNDDYMYMVLNNEFTLKQFEVRTCHKDSERVERSTKMS